MPRGIYPRKKRGNAHNEATKKKVATKKHPVILSDGQVNLDWAPPLPQLLAELDRDRERRKLMDGPPPPASPDIITHKACVNAFMRVWSHRELAEMMLAVISKNAEDGDGGAK